MNEIDTSYPQEGVVKKIVYLIKYHFHIILLAYVWFGLFFCGLAAPPDRVTELGSNIVTQGWHLSALSTVLVLPWLVIYVLRFIYAKKQM